MTPTLCARHNLLPFVVYFAASVATTTLASFYILLSNFQLRSRIRDFFCCCAFLLLLFYFVGCAFFSPEFSCLFRRSMPPHALYLSSAHCFTMLCCYSFSAATPHHPHINTQHTKYTHSGVRGEIKEKK